MLLTPVVVGELHDGFRAGSRYKENMEILSRFTAKPRTVRVSITDATAAWFGEVKRILRQKGRRVPTNDVWIAASCMEHGAHLLSFDAHVGLVDGVLRVSVD